MDFGIATAGVLHFGTGKLSRIGEFAARMGTRALLVTGRTADRHPKVPDSLAQAGIEFASFAVAGEPTVETVATGVDAARSTNAELVIAVGGGSTIDAGKAISALATCDGTVVEHLEVIGTGKRLTRDPLPFIAAPTTAGTGAEATYNAVICSPEHRVKVSLRDERMLPDVAIVDPETTASLPRDTTAVTGMDALTHLVEPFVSVMANPFVDGLCRIGIPNAATALVRIADEDSDKDARERMMLASTLGGIALANAKLGAIHGFAGVIGGRTGAAHGAICAALLPSVVAANVQALFEIHDEHPTLARYGELADMLSGDEGCVPAEAIEWTWRLCQALAIPRLSDLGLEPSDLASVAEDSAGSSSMQGNPVRFDHAQLVRILESAM